MDLTVTIADENNDVLKTINLYQDGSDSEEAHYIADLLQRAYPEAQITIDDVEVEAVIEDEIDGTPSDETLVDQARCMYQDEGSIEIDGGAVVSRGDDPGAYVQAWVWVPF